MILHNLYCILLLTAALAAGCRFQERTLPFPSPGKEEIRRIARQLQVPAGNAPAGLLRITAPCDGAVFPPEIAAPVIAWNDPNPEARFWLVAVETGGRPLVTDVTRETHWSPARKMWETIKQESVETPARIAITGFTDLHSPQPVSDGAVRIRTSTDPVDALILYRQVPLPFQVGEEHFRRIKWRLGDIAAYGEPSVVMEDIPVCASCHQVTADGNRISMEMNYRNDAGAQLIADIRKDIVLSGSDFMTWNDFPKPEILPATRGLFARLSPSGKYLVGTVNEISYMALTNDPAYCQLFFPTYGILAVYAIEKREFRSLKGADDPASIQTDPAFSPDERQIAFARAETRNAYHDDIADVKTHVENCGIEELNRRFPIQFDIWTLPFNGGKGGAPRPLSGASANGMSNYFPRFSPDGRWIVYTRSRSGIMLQPDSELFLIPSTGGEARKMSCNREEFNSWHSWSPNGRWLLFSSKANSIYTEIYITHIDENGSDSPPVRLARFSDGDMAANVPEFVHRRAGRLETIRLKN
ncbi:MAG: TolB family protein [Thermodesulfobacteriota bacterium]